MRKKRCDFEYQLTDYAPREDINFAIEQKQKYGDPYWVKRESKTSNRIAVFCRFDQERGCLRNNYKDGRIIKTKVNDSRRRAEKCLMSETK